MTVTTEGGDGSQAAEAEGGRIPGRGHAIGGSGGAARAVERPAEDGALRLLRGEGLDAVSRESQVPAHELESWKRVVLETGARRLQTRVEPEERELTLARANIRELMMRLELAEPLIENRGFADEWKRSAR